MLANDNDELRTAMDRATDGLPPLPDLVPGALREGRRRRIRSRAITGAVALGAAAAVLAPAALLAPWGDARTGRAADRSVGEMPLVPASWPTDQPLAAPTTAYPTVHVTPTNKEEVPKLDRNEVELQFAFKQKVADVLTKLLPPDAGRIVIPDTDLNAYWLVKGDRTYPITIRVDIGNGSMPPGMGNQPCAARAALGSIEPCADGTLPDGSVISVGADGSSKVGAAPGEVAKLSPAMPMATFGYHGAHVMFAVFPDDRDKAVPSLSPPDGHTDTTPPKTPPADTVPPKTPSADTVSPLTFEHVAEIVTDPTFLEAVDFWRTHPMRYR
jgi:hypothetical protein